MTKPCLSATRHPSLDGAAGKVPPSHHLPATVLNPHPVLFTLRCGGRPAKGWRALVRCVSFHARRREVGVGSAWPFGYQRFFRLRPPGCVVCLGRFWKRPNKLGRDWRPRRIKCLWRQEGARLGNVPVSEMAQGHICFVSTLRYGRTGYTQRCKQGALVSPLTYQGAPPIISRPTHHRQSRQAPQHR
jgi:hypothetical protein